MAKASIATSNELSPSEDRRIGFTLGNTEVELIGTDPSGLLADAYVWRAQVRGLLALAESASERAVNDPSVAYAIENTLGAARTLSELAEAALEFACRLRGVDYDGMHQAGDA
ncbi:hypothetical protein [Rhodanobacter sp. UC4436_H3]